MKRIISMLLTVIMLMSLLPAVSFAAEERETLVYSFLKADNGNVADATLISYNVGNGLLEYHSHNTNHSTSKISGKAPEARGDAWSQFSLIAFRKAQLC